MLCGSKEGRLVHTRGSAEPARYALLGLLLDAPSHGYDLSRRFNRTSALGDIIHLTSSHLYALLTRLELDGSIAGEQQDAGARPQRRVYHLTDAGRTRILRWIGEPVAHPRDMLVEFPLKLYIARMNNAAGALDLIERQRVVFEEYIARLNRQSLSVATPFDASFTALVRVGRVGRAQAALQWLEASILVVGEEHG
jgi:DNA-binding PadR family transcriptional regulator